MKHTGVNPATDATSEVASTIVMRARPMRWLSDFGHRFGIIGAWMIVIIVFSSLRPGSFATVDNFQVIFGSQAILLVLALGLLLALTAGEFDLSFGGVMSVSLVLVGYLNVVQGWPIGVVVLVALAMGLTVGLVNAFFTIVVGIPAVVVTLGTGAILLGTGIGINNVTTGGISENLVDAVRHQVFGLPLAFYYGLGLTAAVWYLFRFTPLGLHLNVVGRQPSAARLVGIRVNTIRAGAMMATSFFSSMAGIMLAGYLGAADPNVSEAFLLPAFAAVFLGATAIIPGQFNPWGCFIAVYFLVTGITGLQLLGYAGWVENVFNGAAVVIAVTLSRLAGRHQQTEGSTMSVHY